MTVRPDLARQALQGAVLGLMGLLGLMGPVRPANAQALPQPCSLVFGQARNEASAGAPDWEAMNEEFNGGVAEALETAGRRARPMTAPALKMDPQSIGLALLQRADELGCRTLVETTVFADDQQTPVLRLRVYPLLPQLDEQASIVGLRIGAPLFVTQRELALAGLPRLKTRLIAQQMTAEYLQHDRR